ncbi:uncharacterized protein A4U43_C09F7900 [Asparagus officinalis]|uniref:protein-serine/threonine phosphatase n=1 Tax=Asparagus officinalis TaxID=4686 RepID=A0A5P1E6I8_ASPOF|nr:uncharacterized protein A4U43_C09F7900 [Asparagus officinalis]
MEERYFGEKKVVSSKKGGDDEGFEIAKLGIDQSIVVKEVVSKLGEYLKDEPWLTLLYSHLKLNWHEALQNTPRNEKEPGFLEDTPMPSRPLSVYNENVLFNVLRKEGFGTLKQGTNGNCAIAVSRDHKPDQTDERQRIEDAGGFVTWAGTWRVGGVLAVSREFGDILLKQYVVADPEIQEEIIDGS